MLVDHERAWLLMKGVIREKRSHGMKDLLAEMARIELECLVPEGQEEFDPRPAGRGSRPATERLRVADRNG